ncbi:hypothetical protein A3742_10450 [Oleiphilus sp. HI0071]|nr:DMT family transporter [Oleiphilus sp. HI0080]KZY62185.1 hypothetical protein A3737_04140 [Oleiphilus sp. HI0065]KZY82150.1 hypothetical protein A3742_10450 [Oleiphilus sp. HI0071]KZZ00809.1 hypothetical protein A3744_11755 [Oleiphilus sp. HI0073]KZZ48329.1 hypothetical protein A3760_15485 [Oleiphilus sp. HI0122]KZZ69455.1 hypothetical protein A3765_17435 [Oleiphilus sp. HI0130]KZZ79262.1 hypothetical protein A3767_11170 [Oleiphilus sp. HI0133]
MPAYLTIVLVWSTTPLAISWSAETMTPVAALGLRMLLAAVVGWVMLYVLAIKISWERDAVRTYAFSQLGIVAAMLCVYSASQFIPSGLISVLFALAPLLSGVFAYFVLSENNFTPDRIAAFLVSFIGLCVICLDGVVVSGEGYKGVLFLLLGVSLYSFSGVKVQQIGFQGNPLATTVGSVVMSVPLFGFAWLVLDGGIPAIDWSSKSPYAVIYLALFGSLLGFCAYFFLLKVAGAAAVAMVTLLTPALALILGALVNGETISVKVYLGTGLILSGLFLYYRKLLLGMRDTSNNSLEQSA